jgi:hypothetical protein
LDPKYVNVPALSIKCFVHNIKPYGFESNEVSAFEWNNAEGNFLFEWVENRNVLAKVSYFLKSQF